MKKIFSVDRIEGDIAVCISDDDIKADVDVSRLGGMAVRDVFEAEYEGGELSCIVPMPEERDARLERGRARLHALAKRGKKQ